MIEFNRVETQSLPLSARVQRFQAMRRRARLQAAASTAGWLAGSAGLLVVAAGGILSLAAR